jgi:arylsulfatase
MKLLLVVIDTLRADHLGCYGYIRNTSPNLDALAEEGILFETCINQTGHTEPTFTTIITGQYPLTHGIVSTLPSNPNEPSQVLDGNTPLLAQQFRQAGHLTAAFDNLMQWPCIPGWFAREYDFYINTVGKGTRFLAAVLAEEINERLIPWLNMYSKEDFFMLTHYWDAHQPYNEPEPYMSMHLDGPEPETQGEFIPRWGWKERLTDAKRQKIGFYDGEITYCDAELGKVFDALRGLGVYDDTWIIVTSDHGEDMEEHNAPFEHREVYEHTIHVPLIVKPALSSGLQADQRVPALVGHIDLMPTLLEIAGIECPESVEGKSLMPLMRGEAQKLHDHVFIHGGAVKQRGEWVSGEIGVRTDEYKYFARGTATLEAGHKPMDIHPLCAPPWRGDRTRPFTDRIKFFNSLPREELYHLPSDLCEIQNVMDGNPPVLTKLKVLLQSYIERNSQRSLL